MGRKEATTWCQVTIPHPVTQCLLVVTTLFLMSNRNLFNVVPKPTDTDPRVNGFTTPSPSCQLIGSYQIRLSPPVSNPGRCWLDQNQCLLSSYVLYQLLELNSKYWHHLCSISSGLETLLWILCLEEYTSQQAASCSDWWTVCACAVCLIKLSVPLTSWVNLPPIVGAPLYCFVQQCALVMM